MNPPGTRRLFSHGLLRCRTASVPATLLLGVLILIALPNSSRAQYRAGDVVGTNFGFVTRYRWTNDNGQVFAPGSVFRLSDFDGKIVFFMFFDVW